MNTLINYPEENKLVKHGPGRVLMPGVGDPNEALGTAQERRLPQVLPGFSPWRFSHMPLMMH